MGPVSERSNRLTRCELEAEVEGEHLPSRRRASERPRDPEDPVVGIKIPLEPRLWLSASRQPWLIPGYGREGLSLV